jgi:glucose 1-dehydrogenase
VTLEGARVVMTGGSRGIGQGVARMFCEEGARVVSLDVRDAAETAALCGEAFAGVTADVADEHQVEQAFATADELLGGPVQVLCCVAGVSPEVAFLDTTVEVFDRTFAVNVRGVFLCGQQAARRMRDAGGGRIINIASTASVQAWMLASVYGASKGAVHLLTKNMALELAQHGIMVNAVGPGSIDTPLAANFRNDEAMYDHDISRTPMGRWGTPDDIARAVRFLARDATWLTGQTIYVDGGFLAAGSPMLAGSAGRISIER